MRSAASLYNEGLKYYHGTDGYPLNYRMAFDLWSQSAQMGLCEAHIGLALMYEEGTLDMVDREKATEHYHQAYYANPNHPMALYHMAKMYANGIGVNEDQQKAVSFLNTYFEVADTSDRDTYCSACYVRGLIYIENQEFSSAVPYISIASERIAYAKYMIGSLSYNGYAKGKYYQEPFTCFKEAAEKGIVSAMYDLGIMYNKANIPGKAEYWLEKAAAKGDKRAAEVLKKLKKLNRWSSFL